MHPGENPHPFSKFSGWAEDAEGSPVAASSPLPVCGSGGLGAEASACYWPVMFEWPKQASSTTSAGEVWHQGAGKLVTAAALCCCPDIASNLSHSASGWCLLQLWQFVTLRQCALFHRNFTRWRASEGRGCRVTTWAC